MLARLRHAAERYTPRFDEPPLTEGALRHRLSYMLVDLGVAIDNNDLDDFAERLLAALPPAPLPEAIVDTVRRLAPPLPAYQAATATDRWLPDTAAEKSAAETSALRAVLEYWERQLRTETWTHIRSLWPSHPSVPIKTIFSELYLLPDATPRHVDGGQRLPTISIDAMLAMLQQRVVVTGDPGSGKTTLVKWIAQAVLEQRFERFVLPIVVLLGPFAQAVRNRHATSLLEYFCAFGGGAAQTEAGTVAAALRRQAQRPGVQGNRGQPLLLLDGWDEVPLQEREHVRGLIEQDSTVFPTLITTRPSGLPQSLRGEKTLYLGELQPPSVHALVQRHCDWIQRAELYPTIINHLYQTPGLLGVAGNPYVLTLLCEVAAHQDASGRGLPRTLAELLTVGIALLCRDQSEQHPALALTEADLRCLEGLAKRLAFGSQTKRYTFSHNDLVDRAPLAFDDSAIVRSRLINKFADHADLYFFVHARFQEFFAARALVQLDAESLARYSRRYSLTTSWQEEFRIAVGLLSVERREILWQVLREALEQQDLFGAIACAAAQLLAAAGVGDGGRQAIGVDLRTALWDDLRNDIGREQTVQALIHLDADELIERIKTEGGLSERAMESVYRALPVAMRRAHRFDEWLAAKGSISGWLVGISAPGLLLGSELEALRRLATDNSAPLVDQLNALRQLGGMHDPHIVPLAVKVLDNPDDPRYEDCVIALGKIGGSQAALGLARALLTVQWVEITTENLPLYLQLADALSTNVYGAIEAASRDLLLRHVALLPPSHQAIELILDALEGVPLVRGSELLFDLVISAAKEGVRHRAVKALAGCTDSAVVRALARVARETEDAKLRTLILRLMNHRFRLADIDWLMERITDKARDLGERRTALNVLADAIRRETAVTPGARDLLVLVNEHLDALAAGQIDELSLQAIDAADLVGESGSARLIVALDAGHDSEVRLRLAEKLGELGADAAADSLFTWLKAQLAVTPHHEGERRISRAIGQALARLCPERLLPLIQKDDAIDSTLVRQVLADVAENQGYRIYPDRIEDADGQVLASTGNQAMPITVVETPPWPDLISESLPDFRPELLIMTATEIELRQLLHRMRPPTGKRKLRQDHIGSQTYYMGQFGAFPAVAMRSTMGSAAPNAASHSARDALERWRPKVLIMVGIAFAARRDKHKPGDVLVATKLFLYEPQRVGTDGVIPRGDIVPVSPTLLNRFTNAFKWSFLRPDGTPVNVWPGPLLSGEKLIDDPVFKQDLMQRYREAIGGEMEGQGVYAAAARDKVDWIIVKGVADWADGEKNSVYQPLAAAAAADLGHFVFSSASALDGL